MKITQPNQLDKHWHVWSLVVKRAADAHIPTTYKNLELSTPSSYLLPEINKNLHKALLSAQMTKFSINPLALTTIVAPNNKSHYENT
ncbi:12017_t:CDS:2, partial [Gigaspora rosea]